MTYFEIKGKENLEKTLELVKLIGEELGIKKIVVASTTGYTVVKALVALKNIDIASTVVGTE